MRVSRLTTVITRSRCGVVERQLGRALSSLVVRLGAALVAVLTLLLMLRGLTNSMLFYPERGQWRTPASLGLEYEEVWMDSLGDRIQGWWMPGGGEGPAILMFHGNAGTIADRLENAQLMIEHLEAAVFLLEYPGYGDSTGSPSEKSLFAAGRAGLMAMSQRVGDRQLVLFGRSLGGAVAIDLAADEPLRESVDALIVESSFTTLADLGRALGFPVAAPLLPYHFDSLEAISRVAAPLLILHGDRDEIVPFAMGGRLHDAATAASSRVFHTIRGAGHNDTVYVGGAEYWRVWRTFLTGVELAETEKAR
jgi:pimeloyl-ACP methyl ester carboxylesterase